MSERVCFDGFELRPDERLLLRDGQPVRIGARAFDLLLVLVAHRDRLVTKAELLDQAWPGLIVEEANIQVQVSALRKVLGPRAIATIPGLGYRLSVAAEPAAPAPRPAPPADEQCCPTNLPDSLEPLVGRDEDLRAVDALLEVHRLVTLLGAGGIGKTSLALAATRGRRGSALDGLWWVDLAALSSPEQLVPGIALAASLPIGSGDPVAGLRHALGARRVMLVLDNGEHLAAPLAGLLRTLLEGAPGLRVLVTSQQALGLAGEQPYRLAPLALPHQDDSLAAARASPAVQLLERRAQAVDRRFRIGDTNLAATIGLCRQLDGLPLAIEMAAARLPILGFQGLQPLLAAPLDRLRSPRHDLPERQRSLRRTLEWSHSLLGVAEQALLRRLSVFAGSFGLEVVQHAAGFDPLDDWTVLDALAGLVDKSLVKLVELEPPRYRLLETTRLYAGEQLEAHGEGAVMQLRHGQAMAAFVEAALPRVRHQAAVRWPAAFLSDYDDLARAFDRAVLRGDAEVAATVLLPLRQIDQLHGLFSSSGRRLAGAQALLARAGPLSQARLHTFIATCGWADPPEGSRFESAHRAVALWRGLDRPHDLHGALAIAASVSARRGDHEAAQALLAEARSLERPDWPTRVQVVRLIHEAWVAGHRGDLGGELEQLRTALHLCERDHEPEMALAVRMLLAEAALDGGEPATSIALARAVIDAAPLAGAAGQLGLAWGLLGAALLVTGELAGARTAVAQAMELLPADAAHRHDLLRTVAVLAAEAGDPACAARLLGHVEAAAGPAAPASVVVAAQARATRETLAATLGAAQAEALHEAGGLLTADEAHRLARASLQRQGVPARAGDPPRDPDPHLFLL